MAFPSTTWPTTADTAETKTNGVSVIYAVDFEYQDSQIRTIQTWLGVTGEFIGEGVAGAGPSGVVTPEADGGVAFTVAARENFTSGTLLSVGDDFDNVYSEKFSIEYNGQAYVDGNRVLTEGAAEFSSITEKVTPVGADLLLIEDSADSNNKKKVQLTNLPSGSGTDADAIHDNVAGEIAAVTAKATPTTSDYLLIEDAADSNNKKSITLGDLPSGSSTDIRAAGIVIGNQPNGDSAADCDALDVGDGTVLKSTIEGASAGDYVFVRAGTYDLGSGPQTRISIPGQVRVDGAGKYQTHVKAWTGADGRVFRIGAAAELRDVYVEAPAPTVQTTAGSIIEGAGGSASWIRNVRVFFTGTWPAAANVAITAAFTASGASILHIDDCWFWGMPNGDSGAAQVNGVDLSTSHTMINGLRTYGGYDALKSSGAYVQATQLNLQNFSHNGIYHSGSTIQGLRSSYSGGLLRGKAYVGITHDGIVIYTAAGAELGVNISDIYLMDSVSASAGVLGYGISIQNADRNVVSNCRIFDYGADGTRLGAIHLDANSDNNVVALNTMGGNTLVDLGTNNDCAHNL